MVGLDDPQEISTRLMDEGADVVVLKMGRLGAFVAWADKTERIPAYQTDFVWKIGSGDVFSAAFSLFWGLDEISPDEATDLASRATAYYCNSRGLPVPTIAGLQELSLKPVRSDAGQVYLAGPFFSLAQRWMIEEARKLLIEMGATVFSPVHEVGPGPASFVAPKDIEGLEASDVVLALVDGMDPGTIFEVGYARSRGIPVVVFAENAKAEDLKMMQGTGCELVDDFSSAIYRTLWRL
jgi:nucleoside 2-deoxyribosyltransferase